MNSQGSTKIVRRSSPHAASLPRGRVIALRRDKAQHSPRSEREPQALARYQSLKKRYGPQALAAVVFMIAATYMATRPVATSPAIMAIDESAVGIDESSSSPDDIAVAYARFGEEVREEARKHAAEIRHSIALERQHRQQEFESAVVTKKVAPTDSRQNLVGKVYKIIKRYAPRHRDAQTLAEAIVSEAESQNYDALFVAAVIKSESAFNALARSNKGAQGLMQIMPATGKWLAKEASLPRGDLTDPGHNLELGVRYLKQLEAQYNGDRVFTLIAYNWGPGHVESAADGKRRIPPEVVTYAIKILNDYRRWRSG
jgi:soluble lytic murein transglycosylase-like protein